MTVVRTDRFKDALMAEVKATYSQPKLEAMGKFMRDIIVKRTQAGIDADGKAFSPYSTTPTYISLKDRPAPRGGIRTPQTKARISAQNRNGKWGAINTTRAQRQKWSVSYDPFTFEGKRAKINGKSMFFPGGYKQYKANRYGPGVNLTKTGRMLGSMFASASGKVILIAFRSDEANTKAAGNDARRDFFGVLRIQKEVERVKQYWQVLNGQ